MNRNEFIGIILELGFNFSIEQSEIDKEEKYSMIDFTIYESDNHNQIITSLSFSYESNYQNSEITQGPDYSVNSKNEPADILYSAGWIKIISLLSATHSICDFKLIKEKIFRIEQ